MRKQSGGPIYWPAVAVWGSGLIVGYGALGAAAWWAFF